MKTRYILTCIAALLAFCACNDTKEEVEINGTQLVLTAYQEGSAGSKTAVEDGGKQVFWEPGDEIKVFSGSRSGKFTSSAKSLEAVTTFTGHLEGTGPDVEDIWAVYPYSDEASFDGECITTVIPSVQVARPGSFAQGANVAIAHSATTNLQFYNVGGGIRFSLTETGVKKVIFEGLGGEVISGTVKVGFEEDLPKVKEVSGGSMFITLLPPEGESFATNTWYYLTAIPGALDSGFKLRFYKDDDTYAKVVSEKAMSIKRKVFGSLANADMGMSYESVTVQYPETKEEWEESFEVTQSIVDAKVEIFANESFDTSDINAVVDALEQVEGVVEVTPNEDASAVSVKQNDGTYVTFDLFDPVPSEDIATESSEPHSFYASNKRGIANRNRDNNKRNVARLFNKSGKALVLSPFQWQFKYEDFDDWYSLLNGIFSEVDTLLNSNAGIDKFKGDFLSQYSFVIILTHGHSGLADAQNGFTTELCSGTIYREGLVGELLNSKLIDANTHVSRFIPKGSSKTYLSALPSILGDVSFNNKTAVLLMGCETAQKTGLTNRTRKMIDAFIDRDAAFVVGNDRSMWSKAINQYVNAFLGTFANGFSLRQAHIYASKSKLAESWCDFVMSEGQSPKQNWNIYEHTLCFPEESSDEYYGINPYPALKTPEPGDKTVLEWDCDLPSSYQVKYLYWGACEYSIIYDVAIDGNDEGRRTSEKEYEISDLAAGRHTAQVVARLFSEGTEIISYPSNTVDFTISNNPSQPSYSTPEAIDLGLTVKWASFNLGASKPEEYGYYYAWGETEPKVDYRISTYKWCDSDQNMLLTKYCNNSICWASSAPLDNKTVLDLEDDAAFANLGGNWRMPTDEECKELVTNCSWTWTSNYHETGIAGRIITSNKVGYENQSIFVPAAGNWGEYALYSVGAFGDYWSSSLNLDNPYYALCIDFSADNVGFTLFDRRYGGSSVRPVYDERIHPVSVELDKNFLSLYVGASATLTATVLPENASIKSVTWASSNESVATVDESGKVRALAAGKATITACSVDASKTASCEVTVMESATTHNGHEYVDLGLPSGLKWATCNVGATSPEEHGDFFAWGETEPYYEPGYALSTDPIWRDGKSEGYAWPSYKWYTQWFDGKYYNDRFTKYCLTDYPYQWGGSGSPDGKVILDDEDDAARAIWGGKWRMPTSSEFEELLNPNYCSWIGTTVNGVIGFFVISKIPGYTDSFFFLPVTDHYHDVYRFFRDDLGLYWTRSLGVSDSSHASMLMFNYFPYDNVIIQLEMQESERCEGLSIRPVCPKD